MARHGKTWQAMNINTTTEIIMNIETNIEFGKEYEDKHSGFKGTATGRATYLHGPDTILIEARLKDETQQPQAKWIEVSRLQVP